MAIAKRSKDDAGPSATSGETKSGRVGKENLLWKGLLRKDEQEKLAKEFSGDGDFTICPGYTGSYGSASDKWGRLWIPGANASYRVARSRLQTWRNKTSTDERFAWWPEAMQRRGVEPVKASDLIKGLHKATWNKYLAVYRKASKVRVGIKTRERRIREAALEHADDPAPAAGVLLALADVSGSTTSDRPGESS